MAARWAPLCSTSSATSRSRPVRDGSRAVLTTGGIAPPSGRIRTESLSISSSSSGRSGGTKRHYSSMATGVAGRTSASRVGLRSQSAPLPHSRSSKRVKGPPPAARNLILASVAPSTLAQYQSEVAEFRLWAASSKRSLANALCTDVTLQHYMEWLHHQREAPQVGRWALFGTMLLLFPQLGRGAQVFPLARAALRGWLKLQPGRIRDPAPLEVAWWVASWLLSQGGRLHTLLACAVVLQVDAYLRPGALLGIRKEDIIGPASGMRGRYRGWTLVLAPSARVARTKTGEQDDTVLLGVAGRSFIPKVASYLLSCTAAGQLVFGDISMALYERKIHAASEALGLAKLRLVPHVFRHTGPSNDAYHQQLTLNDIQARGKWRSALSVRRYEKHATLLRQLALLTKSQQGAADSAARDLPTKLMKSFKN
jgi:integrase